MNFRLIFLLFSIVHTFWSLGLAKHNVYTLHFLYWKIVVRVKDKIWKMEFMTEKNFQLLCLKTSWQQSIVIHSSLLFFFSLNCFNYKAIFSSDSTCQHIPTSSIDTWKLYDSHFEYFIWKNQICWLCRKKQTNLN